MRAPILDQLRRIVRNGLPIIVAGVGCGLTARGAAEGGADVLAAYSTAVCRCRGLPTALSFLPYGDCNALTFEAAPEIVAAALARPVILGIGAHDARDRLDALLDRAAMLGAAGITNEPFACVYGPEIRRELDRAGIGFARELELIRAAATRDMLTLGWASAPEEAAAMAASGADLVGALLGITGAGGGTPTDAIARIDAIAEAALQRKPDALILAHGGILSDAAAVREVLAGSRAHGYVTGSSAERGPVVSAVAAAVRGFRDAALSEQAVRRHG